MYRLCGYRYAICKFFTPTINTRTRKRYMVTQQNTATDTSSLSSRLGRLGLYLGCKQEEVQVQSHTLVT
jgi:hypothetical protein